MDIIQATMQTALFAKNLEYFSSWDKYGYMLRKVRNKCGKL